MNNSQNMDDILKSLTKGQTGREDVEKMVASLSPEQQEKLNSILSDKAQTEKILSSPVAKQLLRALLGDKNG